MSRLTRLLDNPQVYVVADDLVQRDEKGYSGKAIHKLAMFENMCDDYIAKQNEIAAELEKLRLEGKTHSVKFKQLLANKLKNQDLIILLKSYGL